MVLVGRARRARASVVAAFGCTLGTVAPSPRGVSGTAALLRASGVAFEALRVLGVASLLVMAVLTWRDTSRLGRRGRSAGPVAGAVLATVLNPELTVFFFAFLPQFAPAHAYHELSRLLTLSVTFMVMTFVVFVAHGIAAATVRRRLIDRPQVVQRVRRLFAASFVGLGVKLATTSR